VISPGEKRRPHEELARKVNILPREEGTYLLSRSRFRRKKERAIRRRQRRGLAGALTLIRKPDTDRGSGSPQSRPMTPEVIQRELGKIKIGDILLETTEGQKLAVRRVARPDPEQTRILSALNLQLPERLAADSICSEDSDPKN
jgi:hypothetical protein